MKKIFMIFIFIFILFSGCEIKKDVPLIIGSNETPNTAQESIPPEIIPDKTITITVSSFIPQETEFGKIYLEQISLFEKKYPNIKIDHHYSTTSNFLTDIILGFNMNTEPDVLFLPINVINENIPVEKLKSVEEIRQLNSNYVQ
ncbi:hypothetical protein AN642_00795 [Epulopiscium sp. SCG-B10WGA-EpuloA2]|nr:hypothetical protein AN642_00795 [Epulopiscium sp. SCG-B10WGA-EpuloA2]